MNSQNIYRFVVGLAVMLISCTAWSEQFAFVIDKGEVTVTASFCPPERCYTETGVLRGNFTADIDGDSILISDALIKSEVEGFELPEDPNLDSGGTVRDAKFYFEDGILTLKGVVDSRAFDGPLYEYSLVAEATDVPDTGFDPHGFYEARQDFRKCMSPMCGGLYLIKANRAFMRCPDGNLARECYVGTIDWQDVGGNVFSGNETLVLQGVLKRGGDDTFGTFTVSNAYRPISDSKPRGKFVGIEGNGIMCITSPCFSFDQYVLNGKKQTTLSGVNLEYAGGDKSEMEKAFNLMAEGEVLVAAGFNRRTDDFAGPGREFYATQFYLPVNPRQVEILCPAGYTLTDMGCATRHGCFYPDLELINTGVADLVDLQTGGTGAQETYSCVSECEAPAKPLSDGYCISPYSAR